MLALSYCCTYTNKGVCFSDLLVCLLINAECFAMNLMKSMILFGQRNLKIKFSEKIFWLMLRFGNQSTVHPRLSGSLINQLSSIDSYIQSLSLKSTRFTVGRKLESPQTMLSRSSFLILYLNRFVAKLASILVSFFHSLGSLNVV